MEGYSVAPRRDAQRFLAEHAKLRIAGARYFNAFNWADEHGGKAYEWVRYSLCLRAGLACEHLRPG